MIQARGAAAAEGHVRRARRLGRLGGLAAVAVAAAPFAGLWVLSMATADDPLTFRLRLDMAIGFVLATRLGLLGTPG